MALGHVHLTPQFVQAVRDAVEITDVAGEHTRLRKAGRRHVGLCPLHKEKTPSFSVDPARGLFYCFGCGQGGDAIKLHMLLSGDDFPAAIESLARRYGVPVPTRRRGRPGAPEERDLTAVLEEAAAFYRQQLGRHAAPRAYLEGRRVPDEWVERFGLGYAPDGWRHLLEALHPRVPLADLEAAGLVGRSQKSGKPYDRFRHRLIFPIRNPAGRLVGFGGRALGDDPAKYVNTAETSRFHKGTLLYGLDLAKKAIRESGTGCLVEGYFDVVGAAVAGVEGAVASMGTSLTAEQARLLARYADEVVVAYDGDNAGEEAYRRALPVLLAAGIAVRRARLGEGRDPDSLRLEAGPEAVLQAVAEAADGVLGEIDRLTPPEVHGDPNLQARAARAVGELLRQIPDSVLRFGYARRAADRLGVPAELLWRRLGGGRGSGEGAAAGPPVRVRSVEERVLQLLFEESQELPEEADLPPPEVFLEPTLRNIYRAFCALYRGGAGPRPSVRGLLSQLAGEGGEVDRVARLLLEESSALRAGELREALHKLIRRWRQRRLRELASEIARAQSSGDQDRLDNLLQEKTDLSLALHRPGEGGAPGQRD